MNKPLPNALSATVAARQIREGKLSSVDLVTACLVQIDQSDSTIKAWASIDREGALAQAAEMDAIRKSGRAVGPLHGIPVGLKDIIDTKSMPTQRGSTIFAGRQPDADAAIVDRLREAGAVILGKTATTEFAFMHPAQTRNPHNLDFSPGGSSSGSAAAVAAYHVPLAIGTQTNGSVIRPASFCGTYGYKPTRGIVSRRGIFQTSKSLDQVGTFAHTLEDAALLTDAIGGYDPSDNLSFARPRPKMFEGAHTDVPVNPAIVWFDLPFNDRLSDDAKEGMEEVLAALEESGATVERIPVSENLTNLIEVQSTIHLYEICQHQGDVFDAHWDELSTSLQPLVARGREISVAQYEDAVEVMNSANSFFTEFFTEFDAVLAPSAAGQAPRFDSGATGDPIFCTIWTLCGLPCLSMPILSGADGLPVGVQLIGAIEQDDRLFRTANWVLNKLQINPNAD